VVVKVVVVVMLLLLMAYSCSGHDEMLCVCCWFESRPSSVWWLRIFGEFEADVREGFLFLVLFGL
jgi:hypothetical protein